MIDKYYPSQYKHYTIYVWGATHQLLWRSKYFVICTKIYGLVWLSIIFVVIYYNNSRFFPHLICKCQWHFYQHLRCSRVEWCAEAAVQELSLIAKEVDQYAQLQKTFSLPGPGHRGWRRWKSRLQTLLVLTNCRSSKCAKLIFIIQTQN